MHRIILLGCLLLGLGACLAVAGFTLASRSTITPASVDSRLILHPHAITVVAAPPGIGTVHLRIYPAIPGRQRVELTLWPNIRAAHLTLRAAMAGMMMAPSEGKAVRQGSSYRGVLNLPMFGRYRVQVHLSGKSFTLRVVLPLPVAAGATPDA